MYKIRLAASLGMGAPESYSLAEQLRFGVPREPWTAMQVSESSAVPGGYELTVEFPQFAADQEDLAELNILTQARAVELRLQYRRNRFSPPPPPGAYWAEDRDSYLESFEVALLTKYLVSIRYSISIYGAGAAHPNHFTRTSNYQRNPLIPITTTDFLDRSDASIRLISHLCQQDIARQKGLDTPDDWVLDGIPADWQHLETFNIVPHGLVFTFDPYRVGSYADGSFQVCLAPSELAAVVTPGTVVAELWRGTSVA